MTEAKDRVAYGFDDKGKPTHPTTAQYRFHHSKAKFRLYSGAFGAGKTKAGCREAIYKCWRNPGLKGAICRLVSWELRLTTRLTFFEQIKEIEAEVNRIENRDDFFLGDPKFGDADGVYGFRKSENVFKFYNGSIIHFLHLDDFQKLGSLELAFFYLDEGTELNEDVFRMLVGRLRQSGVTYRGGFITTNPADFHNWIYKYFYERNDPDYDIIEATTFDNPYLPKDYVESMTGLYDEDYKKRYLLGIWGTFEGLVYKDWNRSKMVKEFQLELENWTVIGGVDLGVRSPSVLLTIGYDGERIFIIDEYYRKGVASDEFINEAQEIFTKYGHDYIKVDPSGLDTIIRLQQRGLPASKAVNKIEEGIRAVKSFIKPDIIFIHPRCINTIREFETYKYPKMSGTINYDKPLKENDHALDALRYALVDLRETASIQYVDMGDMRF